MTESLFVDNWGEGRPVVFLHGLGASARYWDTLRDATSDDPTAPPAHVQRLAAEARVTGEPVTLTLVDGDHHLAVRHPAVVARVLTETLAAVAR